MNNLIYFFLVLLSTNSIETTIYGFSAEGLFINFLMNFVF